MMRRENRLQKERIWELDAICGFLILEMLLCHLYYTVDAFCINGYYKINSYQWVSLTDPLHFWFDWGEDGVIHQAFLTPQIHAVWIDLTVDSLFVLSGISCVLSRNNLRNTIRLLIGGYFITAVTLGFYLWTGEAKHFMRFGPLLCYAYCHLIFVVLFEKRRNRTLLIAAFLIFIVGYFQRYHPIYTHTSLLLPFGFYPEHMITGDYQPIFPMLGWLLIGVVIGRKYYKEKRSLFPNSVLRRITRLLQLMGQYSGIIYIGHILVYTFLFTVIGHLFQLL